MRVAALFSGGKDSTYALYLLQQQGWEIASLLTVIPRASDPYMFHYPNVRWTKLQAESMGVPIRYKESEGLKEKEKKRDSDRISVFGMKGNILPSSTTRPKTGLVLLSCQSNQARMSARF